MNSIIPDVPTMPDKTKVHKENTQNMINNNYYEKVFHELLSILDDVIDVPHFYMYLKMLCKKLETKNSIVLSKKRD